MLRLFAVFLLAILSVGANAADESLGFMEADAGMVQRLLVPRPSADVDLEVRVAEERLAEAEGTVADYRQTSAVAEARVAVKKQEIDLLKDRIKLAKKEKDSALVDSLQAEVSRQQAQLDIFERIEASASVQADWTRALQKSVSALKSARAAELKLSSSHEERRAEAAGMPADKLQKLDADISELAREYASEMADYAAASEDTAKLLKRVVKTRLDLLERWERYSGRKGLPST